MNSKEKADREYLEAPDDLAGTGGQVKTGKKTCLAIAWFYAKVNACFTWTATVETIYP